MPLVREFNDTFKCKIINDLNSYYMYTFKYLSILKPLVRARGNALMNQ